MALLQDLRLVAGSHHMVISKDFTRLCQIQPHSKPKTTENIEITAKVYCAECFTDWGVQAIYKGVSVILVVLVLV